MKKVKYTLFTFSPDIYKGVEQYLNEQAAQGWELEKVGWSFARFRATDRTDLRYSVDMVPGRKEGQEEYLDLCREVGWEQVARRGAMVMFASLPGRDPVPIQTDPQVEQSNYRREYRRELTMVFGIVLIWAAFCRWILHQTGGVKGSAEVFEQVFRYQWISSWRVLLLWVCVLLLLVSSIPSFCACVRAWGANRKAGRIVAPPRWVLRVNRASSLVSRIEGLMLLVAWVAGYIQSANTSAPIYFGVTGGVCLILTQAASAQEEEKITPGKQRGLAVVGLLLLVMAVLTALVVRVNPNADSMVAFFSCNDDFESYYQEALALDLVTGEDLGLDLEKEWGTFKDEEQGTVKMVQQYVLKQGLGPVGRYAVLMSNLYDELAEFSCARYDCWNEWLAGCAAWVLADQAVAPLYNRFSGAEVFGGADMEPVELDWADEAWYGQWSSGDGERVISVLVLRQGTLAVRISAPVPLMTEELLPVIQARLGL